jgi:hypothetical protein
VSEPSLPPVPDALSGHTDLLAGVVRPCVTYRWGGENSPTPGGTRLYGDPDVPHGFDWPVAHSGEPVPFALQVDLDEVAERFPDRVPLPRRPGVVQFFTTFVSDDHVEEWDTGLFKPERGQNHVVVHRDRTGLRPARGPVVANYDGMDGGKAQPLTPEAALSAPDTGELWRPQHAGLRAVVLAGDDTRVAYQEWAFELSADEQTGGYPRWLQDAGYADAVARERGLTHRDLHGPPGGPGNERLVDDVYAAGDAWHLVFQVNSLIGDDGMFYFVAPLDTDGRYDLDRLQVVYQCT